MERNDESLPIGIPKAHEMSKTSVVAEDQLNDEWVVLTVPKIDEIINNVEVSLDSFKELQLEVGKRVQRKLLPEENRMISACLRERERRRHLHEAQIGRQRVAFDLENNGCNITICTAYSDDYYIGQICEKINRKYASRHGYQFQSTVLSYREMLSIIEPREHCTWYKNNILEIRYIYLFF